MYALEDREETSGCVRSFINAECDLVWEFISAVIHLKVKFTFFFPANDQVVSE